MFNHPIFAPSNTPKPWRPGTPGKLFGVPLVPTESALDRLGSVGLGHIGTHLLVSTQSFQSSRYARRMTSPRILSFEIPCRCKERGGPPFNPHPPNSPVFKPWHPRTRFLNQMATETHPESRPSHSNRQAPHPQASPSLPIFAIQQSQTRDRVEKVWTFP